MQKVGWIFTQSSKARDFILSTEEVVQISQIQEELGDTAVTAVVSLETDEDGSPDVHFEAFQVCIAVPSTCCPLLLFLRSSFCLSSLPPSLSSSLSPPFSSLPPRASSRPTSLMSVAPFLLPLLLSLLPLCVRPPLPFPSFSPPFPDLFPWCLSHKRFLSQWLRVYGNTCTHACASTHRTLRILGTRPFWGNWSPRGLLSHTRKPTLLFLLFLICVLG